MQMTSATYQYPDIKVSGAGLLYLNGVYKFLGLDPTNGRPSWRDGKDTISFSTAWTLWTFGQGFQIVYVSLYDTPFPAALVFYIILNSELWTGIAIAHEYST